jgi:hypothetical protein
MFKVVFVAALLSVALGKGEKTHDGCMCADECLDDMGDGMKWCNTRPKGCDWSWDFCGKSDEMRDGFAMSEVADEMIEAPPPPPMDVSTEGVPDCKPCKGTNEQLGKLEIALALTIHNQMRATVGTPPLKWNCELMCQVQKWADRGKFEHSDCFNSPIPAGENLASGDDGELAAWMWFSEYGAAKGKQATFAKSGHYTAMVWAATKELGCGKSTGKVYLCQYTNDMPNMAGGYEKNVPIFDGSAKKYDKAGLSVKTAKKMFSDFKSWGFPDMPELYDTYNKDVRAGYRARVQPPQQQGQQGWVQCNSHHCYTSVPLVAVPATAGCGLVLFVMGIFVKRSRRRRTHEELIEEGSDQEDHENLMEAALVEHMDREGLPRKSPGEAPQFLRGAAESPAE